MSIHLTPLGYTNRRPAGLPSIDRAALMRAAHTIARQFRAHYANYGEALAYGLGAAWRHVKAVRTIQALRAQVAPVQHTAAQIDTSRRATRRCGSSLWAA